MKILFSVLLLAFSGITHAVEQAETIFKELAPSLYQIRIIDKASGEKSSIGSGFQISADGLVATNYHVISSYARHPEKYRIEYLDNEGGKATLELKSVDVVNDLAIVQREVTGEMPYFKLSESVPMKGEEIYSLGNPHDLGMIVVPGTYNGLKNESFSDRIHFTGSVNSGMSGGPVVNKDRDVVGINVATSGNQIGFLVPHDKLVTLFEATINDELPNIHQQMQLQLNAYQDEFVSTLLNGEWKIKNLAEGMIPTIDVPFIRCWGESNADKADALIMMAVANCSLEENVYIAGNFFTGELEMEFRYMQAKKLSDTKFYQLFKRQISRVMPGNKAGKDDITEFACQHDIVMPTSEAITNKAIFCTRAYKNFVNLYDVLYLGISVDRNQQALISHFTLAGVAKENAQAFTKQFMESVSWK